MSDDKPPFTVDREQPGCVRCGAGGTWVVVGPDGETGIGMEFADPERADEVAELMNHAAEIMRLWNEKKAEPAP
jgi:hypothetical protein